MKRILALLLVFSALLAFNACGGDAEDYIEKIAQLQRRIEELEKLLGAADIPVGDPSGSGAVSSGANALMLGQKTVIDDVIEFTIDSCSWEDEILPSDTSGTYTYKANKEDETFLVLRGTFTNLNGKSFDVDDIHDSEIMVNGKYEFSVFMDAEKPDGTGFSSSTKPLQTVGFVIYSSVSDGVKELFDNATITIHMLNAPEKTGYYFDKDDTYKNVYTITLTKEKIGA